MPYISTEALVGGVLLLVLAFGYQFIPKSTDGTAKSKKKNKKKSGGLVPDKAGIKEKRGKSREDAHPKEEIPLKPIPTDLSAFSTPPTSFAAAASQPPAKPAKPKTLAEKIAPKPRKTKVDDMLAPEDRPATHARVLSVKPANPPLPPPPSTETKVPSYEGDYASSSDEDTSGNATVEDDDGWNVVPNKKKAPVSISMKAVQNTDSSNPSFGGTNGTKLQKKNAKNSEAKRAARAAEEAERLRRLAMHKKELERERINELYTQQKKTKPGQTGGVGRPAAGATLDTNGKLVWD